MALTFCIEIRPQGVAAGHMWKFFVFGADNGLVTQERRRLWAAVAEQPANGPALR
jgi:hypothetical protein